MDKVRAFLTVCYQQRFWILSVLGLIVVAVCWMMASGSLDAEFTANRTTIDGKFKDMQDISRKAVHGNDAVNQAEREQAMQIRKRVLALWEKMYNRQRDEVLKWPDSLGPEFLEYVENMKFRDVIQSPDIRDTYRTFAKDRFPALVEIPKAKKIPLEDLVAGAGAGRGGEFPGGYAGRGGEGAGEPLLDQNGNVIPTEKYIVEWFNQAEVASKLNFVGKPTSLQIWITQEDLWVYETLLHVIADTNEANGATRPDNAAIRWIISLDVGEKAGTALKTPGMVALAAAAASGEDPSAMGRNEAGGPVDPAAAEAMLLNYRYIGPDGAVLADGAAVTGGEFRMLPVRMELLMEQKAIPSLMIECANATLPIEVKRVRINPSESGAGFPMTFSVPGADGGGGGDGGRGGGGGGRGFSSEFSGGGGGRGGGGATPTLTPGMSSAGMATVEIHGIVYIYNPPDPAVLTVPGMDEAAAAETAAVDAGVVAQ